MKVLIAGSYPMLFHRNFLQYSKNMGSVDMGTLKVLTIGKGKGKEKEKEKKEEKEKEKEEEKEKEREKEESVVVTIEPNSPASSVQDVTTPEEQIYRDDYRTTKDEDGDDSEYEFVKEGAADNNDSPIFTDHEDSDDQED